MQKNIFLICLGFQCNAGITQIPVKSTYTDTYTYTDPSIKIARAKALYDQTKKNVNSLILDIQGFNQCAVRDDLIEIHLPSSTVETINGMEMTITKQANKDGTTEYLCEWELNVAPFIQDAQNSDLNTLNEILQIHKRLFEKLNSTKETKGFAEYHRNNILNPITEIMTTKTCEQCEQ